MPQDRLPEIREEDAAPAVRAIYEDIKRATGTPQVNLIFRHLALEPAVLDWCWRTIAPAYRDGRVTAAAGRLQAGAPAPATPPVWQGMAPADAAGVQAVLAYYNRGNASNLVGLTTLLRTARGSFDWAARPAGSPGGPSGVRPGARSGGSPAADAMSGGAAAAQPAPQPVPPLPRYDAIAPELLTLISELARRQGTTAFGVVPSLWLHLTLWPDAVRRAHKTVEPLLGTEGWQASVDALLVSARARADELARGLDVPQAPPAEVLNGYLRTVERFVTTAIPQMVLVGRILSGGGGTAGGS